jgi:hypothetical protein
MSREATETARGLGCFGLGLILFCFCHCTTANPNYPDMLSCNLGDRQCGTPTDRPISLVCGQDSTDSLAWLQEPCPIGTVCDSGNATCAPAQGAMSCQSQSDCSTGQSCVPLVSNGALSNFCVTNQPSAMPGGTACTQDSDCQSYHCLEQQQGLTCLLTCATNSNCQQPAVCQTLNVTITGVQGMVGSCSPP